MKRFHFLMALLLAGGLSFSSLYAAPSATVNLLTTEVGSAPSQEEKVALQSASEMTGYTYSMLVEKYVRGEVHVDVVDPSHCTVCIMTSPGNFIILDLEDEE